MPSYILFLIMQSTQHEEALSYLINGTIEVN